MAWAKLVGAEVKRKEDPRLITGAGSFVGDIKLPGMLHVAILRSPHAHARINHIDTAAATAKPGVIAVFTGQDTKNGINPLYSGGGEGGGPTAPRARLALADGIVRHTGDPVAAVVATSAEAAADAAQEIMVDWDVLPAVVDMFEALKPGAPIVWAGLENNIDHGHSAKAGDMDAAYAGAHKVVGARMANQRLSGVPMEPRASLAAPDPMSGGVTLWASTQSAHGIRGEVAKALSLSENQVRVIAPDVGGGFGIKVGCFPEDALVSWLALRLKVPVLWVESRSEHMQVSTHGRAQVNDIEAAVDADGKVRGLKMRIVADLGAYPVAAIIPNLTIMMGTGVYDIQNIDLDVQCVYTNTTSVAAYRGAGRPEAAFYLERLMDLIAADLNLDPGEVRRRNYIAPNKFPYKSPCGVTYDSGEYAKALEKALQVSQYNALRAEQASRRASGSSKLLGIGLASYVEMCGFGPYESAQIKVEPSGTVTVTTGISPHGQGGGTTFAQLLADELQVDIDNIVVKWGDTNNTPMGIGTMGSRSIAVGGSALVRAAAEIRHKAARIAGHILEASPDDIELVDGKYQVKGVPSKNLTLNQIAGRAYTDQLPADLDPGLEATNYFKPPDLIYPFGTHVAVVEVDRDTGDTKIRAYYSVDDCGPRISPNLVAGQVHGGLAQGIAQALCEEVVYDENGQMLTGTLMDYAMPKADLFPDFTLDQTVTPTPLNPLGAKGIGEAATIGSTPAIANAVNDAVRHLGVRHLDIPLRAERVWRAVNA